MAPLKEKKVWLTEIYFRGCPLSLLGDQLTLDRVLKVKNRPVFVLEAGGARKLERQAMTTTVFHRGIITVSLALLFASVTTDTCGQEPKSIQCENNLKQIGLGLAMWELDHDGFPFNVSTKKGGTKELCDRDADGFDRNAARHFQVMSKELVWPKILVCPADSAKQVASSFKSLQSTNVTHQLRSGTNVVSELPKALLARCPIHGHILRCDGKFEKGK